MLRELCPSEQNLQNAFDCLTVAYFRFQNRRAARRKRNDRSPGISKIGNCGGGGGGGAAGAGAVASCIFLPNSSKS